MLSKIKKFVKDNKGNILLLISIVLISLLSFGVGFLAGVNQQKEPLRIKESKIDYE